MRPHLRRPSPAMLVALTALVVALSGTAVAATLISGRSIRRNSIPADRVRRNSLGGGRIAERLLGKVPRAKVADRAGLAFGAANAARVGNQSVQKIAVRMARGTGEQQVGGQNGLGIYVSCSSTGVVSARVVTAVENSEAQVGGILTGTNKTSGGHNGDFDPGESVDLDRGSNGITGTFTYLRPDGVGATMPYSTSGGTVCHFIGDLISG